MKTRNLLDFALFITIAALLSGCQRTDSNLASENADLKARVQQLEKQLQAAQGQAASQVSAQSQSSAAAGDLQSQLTEAQNKAEMAANESKSLNSQIDALKQKVDQLTQQLSEAQQARENAEKALMLYRDKATSALKQFQALRGTLDGQVPSLDAYHQNFLNTQSVVNDALAALPESQIRRQIAVVQAQFAQLDNVWQTADRQIQTRSQQYQADYNKLMDFGGLGPNRYTTELGKDRILAPMAKANAATALNRNEQMMSQAKNLDSAIQNLQALLNG